MSEEDRISAHSNLDGGCHCGRVRYRVESIFDAGYCHCSVCRRVHGAPVVAWIAVPESDFTLLAGSPRAYRSSAHGARHRCRTEAAHGDLEHELRQLEESHLCADVRSSPEAMRALLADDFVEFGSSGRVLDRVAVEASVGTAGVRVADRGLRRA